MKCMLPLVLIADIALTENRLPVLRTTGAGEEHIAALGLRPGPDRRPGLLPPDADRFRLLLDGPLVRALEGQAPAAQVLAHALVGQPHPVQLRYQATDAGTCPQLPGQSEVAGT